MGEEQEVRKVEVSWVQVSASALAAVSSAVLLSTVGVAGTLIGAAVGSVIATVGSQVYSHYLRVSRDRVTRAQAAALQRVAQARASTRTMQSLVREDKGGAERSAEQATRQLDEAAEQIEGADPAEAGPTWREVLRALPWKRIAAVTAAVFVAVMIAIFVFESITGRAVSSYTGGSDKGTSSTIPGLGGSASSSDETPAPSPSPSAETSTDPAGSPSGATTSGTTDASPSAQPSGEASETTASPTTPAETPLPSSSVTGLPPAATSTP